MKTQRIRNLGLSAAVAVCAVAASAYASPTGGLAYEHSFDRTQFSVGANARSTGDAKHEVIEGDSGAFYTDLHTRSTLAVRNGGRIPTPLSSDANVHSAVAKQYFLAAGIPSAEVSGTHVTTTMMGGGWVATGWDPAYTKLLYYTTHLERSVGGVPVEGSVAFVAFDAAQEVITEAVYWPAIPADVVARAQALSQKLSVAADRAQYIDAVTKVKPEVADIPGEVKILHTGAGSEGAFEARAVYMVYVTNPGGRGTRELFDELGNPVKFDVMTISGSTASDSSAKVR